MFNAGTTEPLRTHVEARELGDRRWRDEGVGLKITGYGGEVGGEVRVGDEVPLPPLEEGNGKWRDDDEWSADVAVARVPGEGVGLEGAAGGAVVVGAAAASAAVAGHSAAGGSKSRAESRLARRQRRELAGKYKPDASVRGEKQQQQQSQEEAGQDEGRDSVLKMIEGMDGPALPKAKEKTPKNKAAEFEKPTKAQRLEKKASQSAWLEKADKLLKSKDSKSNPSKTRDPPAPKPKREDWQVQKTANLNKFGNAVWQPRKRLSPDTLEGIRALHASDPATYSTATLSSQFEVSPENIRRILKSKWKPSDEEKEERSLRWERRGVRKWTEMAEQGERPPRRWREMGVGSVKGEPERKPGWKRGGSGRKKEEEGFDDEWQGDGFEGRIL